LFDLNNEYTLESVTMNVIITNILVDIYTLVRAVY